MTDSADIRRQVLRLLVERDGLAVTARKFGKPDRQIKDMIEERKSFGEKVARDMERNYAPDRAPGWLDRLDAQELPPKAAEFADRVVRELAARDVPEHMMETILTIIASSPKKKPE